MSSKYTLKKGQVLFKEGSFSDAAFIIESGKVEISVNNSGGQKTVIGVLRDNDIVGEMGLIDGNPRSATVTAISDVKIKEITREQF
jgi:CRP/FNR family transcriptional regulator, cyclic AMP receptor protein